MTLLRRIVYRALRHPRKTAVTDDQRSYTCLQLVAGAMFVAKAIEKATDKPRVGIMLPTSGAFPIALMGAWLAKKVPVPLNYLLSKDELAHVVADSGIDVILTAGKMVEHLKSTGIDAAELPGSPRLLKLEELSFKGIPPLRIPPKHDDDAMAVLLYTSGTSGKPKGVMLSHGNLRTNVEGCITHSGITKCDSFLGVLPQFHSFGLTVLTLLPLAMGSPIVYTARFVPRRLVELIREHKPHVIIAVPSMYGAMATVKSAEPKDFASLRFVVSGGEPLPQAVFDRCREQMGIEILEGYGLTETSPATNWSTPEHHRQYAVGRPLPNVMNLIVDDRNELLGPGEEGEILIAGPNVMQGYFNMPELTDEVIFTLDVPGHGPTRCFRTGDIGTVDAEGYLRITGRKKEMLIIGGENVFPREIEEVLNRHPSVHDSAVVGKPDDMRGEVPIAFVEIAEGEAFDADALRQHCRDTIAPFKVPREVRQIETLPRSATGKILRRQLTV